MKPCVANVPAHSVIQSRLADASFFDAYAIQNLQPGRNILAVWLDTVQKTPWWVNHLMKLRNVIVAPLGLKHDGELSSFDALKKAHEYRVGDRVGIFTIYEMSDDEVLMGETDKHLDVCLSLCKVDQGARLVLSTVVHEKNFLGNLYMFFIKPMHRVIAPAVMSKI